MPFNENIEQFALLQKTSCFKTCSAELVINSNCRRLTELWKSYLKLVIRLTWYYMTHSKISIHFKNYIIVILVILSMIVMQIHILVLVLMDYSMLLCEGTIAKDRLDCTKHSSNNLHYIIIWVSLLKYCTPLHNASVNVGMQSYSVCIKAQKKTN